MKKLITSILFMGLIFSTNAQNGAPDATNATSGTLTVTTKTLTYYGTHAPSHYLAIWVENASGSFVKTLYASSKCQNVQDLTYWVAKNSTKNVIDATTGATITSHGTVTVTWDGTNTATPRVQQPDGNYIVKMEMTENEGTGKLSTYTFTKGTTSSIGVISGTAATCFTNVSLSWVPANTGIQEIKLGNLYTVYPNPTKSTIFVNGFDIKSVIIYNLEGKQLIKSIEPRVNLSALPRGTYMAEVATSKGLFMKKIVKE